MGDLEKPGQALQVREQPCSHKVFSLPWLSGVHAGLAAHQSLDASTKGICVNHFVNSPWMPLWRTVPGWACMLETTCRLHTGPPGRALMCEGLPQRAPAPVLARLQPQQQQARQFLAPAAGHLGPEALKETPIASKLAGKLRLGCSQGTPFPRP